MHEYKSCDQGVQMKSKEVSSLREVNLLLKKGWRIYKIEKGKQERETVFWMVKD